MRSRQRLQKRRVCGEALLKQGDNGAKRGWSSEKGCSVRKSLTLSVYNRIMFKYIIPAYPTPDSETGIWRPEDLDALSSLSEVAGPDTTSDQGEETPKIPGVPMKHQRAVANIMSGASGVRSLMLVHEVGTGKTCTAVSAMERNLGDRMFGMRKGLVLVPSSSIQRNFLNELENRCTTRFSPSAKVRGLMPDGSIELSEDVRLIPEKKRDNWRRYYTMDTYERFARSIKNKSDEELNVMYNSTFIILDEVHMLSSRTSHKYIAIDRLLRSVRNKKLLMLTGTPVRDNAADFATVFNLMMDVDQKLDVDNFNERYLQADGSPKPELSEKLAGRVSFLSADSMDLRIIHEGVSPTNMTTKLVPSVMSEFQAAVYERAWEASKREIREDANVAVVGPDRDVAYLDARQACRFVFPDGSYGNHGPNEEKEGGYKNPQFVTFTGSSSMGRFTKYLRQVLTTMPDGRTARTDEELHSVISRYSARYADMALRISKAAEHGEKSLVFDNLITGSGLFVFAGILELFGFTRGVGNGRPGRSYEIMAGGLSTNITTIQTHFNDIENARGKNLMVILGSKVIATGLTFRDVIHEHVVAHWNDSETRQIIGRGIRTGSHASFRATLPPGETVSVHVYRTASILADPARLGESVEMFMYELSEQKRKVIDGIINAAKMLSITCRAFSGRNGMNPSAIDPNTGRPYDNGQLSCSFPSRLTALNYENAVATEIWDRQRMKRLGMVLKNLGMCTIPQLGDRMRALGYEFEPAIDVAYLMHLIRTGAVINPDDEPNQPRLVLHDEDGILYVSPGLDVYQDSFMSRYLYRNTHGRAGTEQMVYENYMVEFADRFLAQRVLGGEVPSAWEFPPSTLQTLIQDCVITEMLGADLAPANTSWDTVKAVLSRYRDFWCGPDEVINAMKQMNLSTELNNELIVAAVWYMAGVSGESTEPAVLRLKTFLDQESSAYTGWSGTNNSTSMEILMRVRDNRLVRTGDVARSLDLQFTGLINPIHGNFCMMPNRTQDDVGVQGNKRNLKVGKTCRYYDKPQLVTVAATLANRSHDEKFKQELGKRSRTELCRAIQEEYTNNGLNVYDSSCGVQAKRRR
jgi:SNF2-related domain